MLLGDTSVGKTCLLRRFVRQEFANDYKATIGAGEFFFRARLCAFVLKRQLFFSCFVFLGLHSPLIDFLSKEIEVRIFFLYVFLFFCFFACHAR